MLSKMFNAQPHVWAAEAKRSSACRTSFASATMVLVALFGTKNPRTPRISYSSTADNAMQLKLLSTISCVCVLCVGSNERLTKVLGSAMACQGSSS